jgi:hypothetical protein
MKTTSLALTVSRMRFATVVLPEPVPPDIPIIKLTKMLPVFYWKNVVMKATTLATAV